MCVSHGSGSGLDGHRRSGKRTRFDEWMNEPIPNLQIKCVNRTHLLERRERDRSGVPIVLLQEQGRQGVRARVADAGAAEAEGLEVGAGAGACCVLGPWFVVCGVGSIIRLGPIVVSQTAATKARTRAERLHQGQEALVRDGGEVERQAAQRGQGPPCNGGGCSGIYAYSWRVRL